MSAPSTRRAPPDLSTRRREPKQAISATLKRTFTEFRADNLTDWAAALTYYAMLSLFPMLIVLIALLGLFGQYPKTSDAVLGIIGQVGPSSAVQTFRGPIEGVVKAKGGAGALLGLGLLGAIWAASGYVGAHHATLPNQPPDDRHTRAAPRGEVLRTIRVHLGRSSDRAYWSARAG